MRDRICSIQAVPSRQGVHLPHDSRAKKRTRLWQAATASVVSSITAANQAMPYWSTPTPRHAMSSDYNKIPHRPSLVVFMPNTPTQPLAEKPRRISSIHIAKQLQFSFLAAIMGNESRYAR